MFKLRMSRKKPVQEMEVGGGTGDLSGCEPVRKVAVPSWDDGERIGEQAKRGIISSFSHRSRNRLLDLINSICQEDAPAERWRFVTLTYHQQDVTPRESKAHLQAFLKRLDRHCLQPVGAIWKVEPQRRGMPHYHLLILLPADHKTDVEAEREWFARAWVEITLGTPEQYRVHRHGGTGAAWQQLESWEHVAGYTGKYVGKVVNVPNESAWAKAGRWWGKVNADRLPIRVESVTFEDQEAVKSQRLSRRIAKAKARAEGFTLYLNGEVLKLQGSTWESRKSLRAAGCLVTSRRAWIRGGFGGRLYMEESESMRLLAYAKGIRVGWGTGQKPNMVVLGYDVPTPDQIPF